MLCLEEVRQVAVPCQLNVRKLQCLVDLGAKSAIYDCLVAVCIGEA